MTPLCVSDLIYVLAQVGWIYLAPSGQRYRVGVYHGASTGHVLIYVNGGITKIDFSVRKNKAYGFFIEEEYVTISLINDADQWTYSFHRDEDMDTTANRVRQARERKHFMYFIFFFILIALIIFVLIAYII